MPRNNLQKKSQVRAVRGADSHRRGWYAEWQALAYLMAKGYWPCAVRFRTAKGEIDIIVRQGNLFVAVEVKARPDQTLGHEAMTDRDWRRRAAAMADFMRRSKYKNAYKNCSVRFDLVVVNPYFQLNHVESAWQPEFPAF